MPEPRAPLPKSSVALVLTNHPTGGWCYSIDERRQVIGRGEQADIPVPSQFRSVSRKHAEVWRDRRGCWIHDLGSRVGTRINLVWIDRLAQAELVPGDLVSLGGTVEMQVVSGLLDDEPCDDLDSDLVGSQPGDDPTIGLIPQASRRQILREYVSPAEIELMLWISRGYLDNDELGRFLHRSPHTIRTQVNSILRKLGLHNRGDIVGWLKRPAGGGKPGSSNP